MKTTLIWLLLAEGFLVTGLVDYLKEKGLPVVGPTKAVAALEGSKIFSKVLCGIMEYRQRLRDILRF